MPALHPRFIHAAREYFNKGESSSFLCKVSMATLTWLTWQHSPPSLKDPGNCTVIRVAAVAQILSSAHRCGNWLVAKEHKMPGAKAYTYNKDSISKS